MLFGAVLVVSLVYFNVALSALKSYPVPADNRLAVCLRIKLSSNIHTSGGGLKVGAAPRAAVFDAGTRQLYVGQTNHLGAAMSHNLPISSGRLVGGWVRVAKDGTVRFSHGSGSFPGMQVQNVIAHNVDDLIRGIGVRVTTPL